MIITANEIKTKGVSLIEKILKKRGEAIISVRGKVKFVVLPIEEYERLRDAEMEIAIKEALKDYKDGKFVEETAKEHFKRIGI